MLVADEEEKSDETGEAKPVTTSATPPPLESDPFAITGLDSHPPKQTSAISSGPFEISRASFAPAPQDDLPPSTMIANAMGRAKPGLSLGAIAGIGAAILVVAVGLSLLLFR